jgi:hypothetical protein
MRFLFFNFMLFSLVGLQGCGLDSASSSKKPGALDGYWVWEKRMFGNTPQSGGIDKGQMKMAFGRGNKKCHYLWNETSGSDFHTECTYSIRNDMITLIAPAGKGAKTAGYSCAHPGWTSWNDRPAAQYSRYKFVDDRLWMGVNTYWGFGGGVDKVPPNGSLKRFPFWESLSQASKLESWIVFKQVSKEEWFTKYAISTKCQGSAEACASLPGCGSGVKPYVDE